jgi:membrane associated rhomboid family serine protease
MNDMSNPAPRPAPGEPAINAPWAVAALIVVLLGAHAARVLSAGDIDRFALTSSDLAGGRLRGLITYQLVHGSWAHVLMNSAFVLAFGAPVARFLGRGARGSVAFFLFFIACGVAAAAAYAGLETVMAPFRRSSAGWALVGASGAASGLMGAAARLIEGRGRLGAMTGRTVTGMGLSWIAVNAVLGLSGLTPGAAGAPVAWEAHIFGFFCGLLLIGPAGWLANAKGDHAIAL